MRTASLAALAALCLAACGGGGRPGRALVGASAGAVGRFAAHPTTLSFSVGGDLVAGGLRWTGWGEASADGTGTFAFRDSGGAVTRVRGTVSLSGLMRCRGRRYYTRAVVHASGGPFTPRGPIGFSSPCG